MKQRQKVNCKKMLKIAKVVFLVLFFFIFNLDFCSSQENHKYLYKNLKEEYLPQDNPKASVALELDLLS